MGLDANAAPTRRAGQVSNSNSSKDPITTIDEATSAITKLIGERFSRDLQCVWIIRDGTNLRCTSSMTPYETAGHLVAALEAIVQQGDLSLAEEVFALQPKPPLPPDPCLN